MFKKIIALLSLSVVMCTTVSAADDTAQKKKVLKELGVLSERPMTCGGFIDSLSGYLFEDPDAVGTTEYIARSTKMIESDEEFNGNATITVEQAYKFAVITLGYKVAAENSGNYMQTASQIGLTDGIGVSAENILYENAAIQILYNMLDAKPMQRYYNGEYDNGYVVEEGETILSLNRDIHEVKGILTGTEITSIYGKEYVAEKGCIMIDDEQYISETNEFNNLLGKNVIAYVKETDSFEYEVLYVYDNTKKNDTITIESEDIEEIGDSISTITYSNSTDRLKTLKIVNSPRVIYNGVFTEDYTKDDFQDAVIELIDNNKDGKYDVIKITAYKTMIVESVDARDMLIRNRYKFENSKQELDLYETEYKIYDSTGLESELHGIKPDDVLSVAESKDGQLINIYISGNQSLQGKVTKIDSDEDILSIDGTDYEVSPDFKRYMISKGEDVKIGDTYTFYVDYFGKIAYVKEQVDNDYHLLLKVYLDEETVDYCAVFMDMNGDWYTKKVSPKAKIDGIRYNNISDEMNAIKDEGPQVVILKYNSKDEVTEIDRASNYTGSYTKAFCKKAEMKYTFRNSAKFFHNGTDIIYLEDDAKVIVFPTEDIYNKENWQVTRASGFFDGDDDYTITCYNPNQFRFTDLVTISNSSQLAESRVSKSLYVITGFEERLVDGEPLPVIKGNVGQFRDLSFIGERKGMFDKFEIGDVVNFALNSKGKVEYIEKILSLTNFEQKIGEVYTTSSFHAGTVDEIDIENGRMIVDCGVLIPLKINADNSVTVFESSRKICENKTAAVLKPGDKVVVGMTWGKVEEIVCVRK